MEDPLSQLLSLTMLCFYYSALIKEGLILFFIVLILRHEEQVKQQLLHLQGLPLVFEKSVA